MLMFSVIKVDIGGFSVECLKFRDYSNKKEKKSLQNIKLSTLNRKFAYIKRSILGSHGTPASSLTDPVKGAITPPFFIFVLWRPSLFLPQLLINEKKNTQPFLQSNLFLKRIVACGLRWRTHLYLELLHGEERMNKEEDIKFLKIQVDTSFWFL